MFTQHNLAKTTDDNRKIFRNMQKKKDVCSFLNADLVALQKQSNALNNKYVPA